MATNISVVEDKEVEEINGVRTLFKQVIKGDDGDEFAKDAKELKSLGGTNAAFKARVTREIKKFQQGADGAASKQIYDKEFYSGYDAFDVVIPPYNLEHLTKLYEISSTNYAACNAKVANIAGLGYKFTETRKTKRKLEEANGKPDKIKRMRKTLEIHREELIDIFDGFNKEDTFSETLVKVWRDYESTGNGYIEVGRKKNGQIGYVGHVPSKTIRIRRKRDGFVQISGYETQFFAPFGKAGTNPLGGGKPNEIIHIKKYSPTTTYYGVPDIIAAQQAVAGNEFAARYNLDFFENMAVPRHAVILKGAKLGTQSENALLSFLETGLKGQNHRSIYIPLPADTGDNKVELKFEKIMSDVQDSSFTSYRKDNRDDILSVHRVPITKISVSDGASLAISKDAEKTFLEEVCRPEQSMLEKKVNLITDEFSDAFILDLNEMTLSDEDTRSKIDDRDRKAGIKTANEVRIERGMPTIEGGDELFDLNGSAKTKAEETTNRQRDTSRTANATDSAGRARNPKGEGRTEGTS